MRPVPKIRRCKVLQNRIEIYPHPIIWYEASCSRLMQFTTLHKKASFALRISSVNMTKPAGNCEIVHIY